MPSPPLAARSFRAGAPGWRLRVVRVAICSGRPDGIRGVVEEELAETGPSGRGMFEMRLAILLREVPGTVGRRWLCGVDGREVAVSAARRAVVPRRGARLEIAGGAGGCAGLTAGRLPFPPLAARSFRAGAPGWRLREGKDHNLSRVAPTVCAGSWKSRWPKRAPIGPGMLEMRLVRLLWEVAAAVCRWLRGVGGRVVPVSRYAAVLRAGARVVPDGLRGALGGRAEVGLIGAGDV